MSNNIKFPSNNSPYTHIYEYYSKVTEDELKRIAELKQVKFLKELQEKFNEPDLQRHIAKTIRNHIINFLGIENNPKKASKTKKNKGVSPIKKVEHITAIDKSEEKDIIFLDKKSAEKVNSVDSELESLKTEIERLEKEKLKLNEIISKYEKVTNSANYVNKELLIKDLNSSIYMSNPETVDITVNRLCFTELLKYFKENHPELMLDAAVKFAGTNTTIANTTFLLFLKENGYKVM